MLQLSVCASRQIHVQNTTFAGMMCMVHHTRKCFILMKIHALLLLALLSSACISKKTYQSAITAHQASQDSLRLILVDKNTQIDTLQSELDYTKGGYNALLATQDRLQDRLDVLQLEIDQLNKNASSSQTSYGDRIQALNEEIDTRQLTLDQIQSLLETRDNRLRELETGLTDALANQDVDAGLYQFRLQAGQLRLALNETLLFSTGSTSRMKSNGKEVLEKTVEILNAYPEMRVQVIGHTDNQPVNRQSLDNWQYSALRAVSVVKYLTGDAGLSTSRVLAASSGKFAPMTSNETKEGRAENRRIELLIYASDNDLKRDLLRVLEE